MITLLGALTASLMALVAVKLFSTVAGAGAYMTSMLLAFLGSSSIPQLPMPPAALLALAAAAALIPLLPIPDLKCTRDYSYKCPLDWKSLSGSLCEAPQDYAVCETFYDKIFKKILRDRVPFKWRWVFLTPRKSPNRVNSAKCVAIF
eukprot:GHVR01146323.1.p2 GENE.GHVR01146323.1~~GHVR01146323.1.p2  ORF type:complete len:147 (-),score=8.48 GHVR01146323.1:1951-2391(-)